jgi:hypothetical protein
MQELSDVFQAENLVWAENKVGEPGLMLIVFSSSFIFLFDSYRSGNR